MKGKRFLIEVETIKGSCGKCCFGGSSKCMSSIFGMSCGLEGSSVIFKHISTTPKTDETEVFELNKNSSNIGLDELSLEVTPEEKDMLTACATHGCV